MAPTDVKEVGKLLVELTFDSPVKLPTRRETTRRDMKLRNFRRTKCRSGHWNRMPYDDGYTDFVIHQEKKKHNPPRGTRRRYWEQEDG